MISSPGESFVVNNNDPALCCAACHSNDVLLSGFFDDLLCDVLQQFVGYNDVVIFFSL